MKKLDTCINCKVDADTAARFSKLASLRGTDMSHLIRELIDRELDHAHSQFIALSDVFAKVNDVNGVNDRNGGDQ